MLELTFKILVDRYEDDPLWCEEDLGADEVQAALEMALHEEDHFYASRIQLINASLVKEIASV